MNIIKQIKLINTHSHTNTVEHVFANLSLCASNQINQEAPTREPIIIAVAKKHSAEAVAAALTQVPIQHRALMLTLGTFLEAKRLNAPPHHPQVGIVVVVVVGGSILLRPSRHATTRSAYIIPRAEVQCKCLCHN